MSGHKISSDIRSTFKSGDTEEFIDIHFYRPAGYLWAVLFRRLQVSPNAVTILAIILGIAAGVCFHSGNLMVNVCGMLLLIWANMYDSADGQLARMTGKATPFGRMLDGFCGDAWFIAIYAAICFRLMPQWGMWIWVLGAVTGYCHTKQASLADCYRNVHLFFLKGRSNSELSRSSTLKGDLPGLSWKKDFILRLGNTIYANYTAGQERRTPRLQELLSAVDERYAGDPPAWLREAFRAKSLPLMKYTNMLSFNTRAIALFVSLFVNQPWLYFAFELTALNIMLVYMKTRHERICATFTRELKSSTYVGSR
ncbi:MAG: CDP-alcohol phosphatidyltransferase family protein [Tannerellaceae bacterium]|jgi:hypothetical protein|nr:CDP-alcohol phosphatidyltransferase family protein [Tannerellaceae bacterium]